MNPAGRRDRDRQGGPAVERLRRAVSERTGLDLSGGRGDAFRAALARRARGAGRDEAALADELLHGHLPLAPFVEELTVGETWFFRDPAQWAFVEAVVLPEASARRARAPHRFRGWSAGCATGEEAYSLAILLARAGLGDDVHLVGTDLNETALARARAAEFSLWSIRGDAGARAMPYLREGGGKLVLDRDLADRVSFFPLNLAGGEYPSASRGLADLDLVLCRNVLIYLEPRRVPEVARRLFSCLAPGAWLLAGASDPILSRHAPFDVRAGPHGLAYRRPEAGVALPAAGRRELHAAARTVAGPLRASRSAPRPRASPAGPRARGALSAHDAGPPARSAPAVDDARALLDAGHPGEALAALDAALAREPLDADAQFERAVALTELGRLDAAEDACRRALYLARDRPFVHFFLAMLRLGGGDASGAARAFRTAAALAARLPREEVVPLSHGMTAGALADAARLAGGGGPAARR